MSVSGRIQGRTKSRGHQEVVLLTDELESTIGKLKAHAAERKSLSKGHLSPAFKSPLRRAHTDISSASRSSETGAAVTVAAPDATDAAGLTRANSFGGEEPLRRRPGGGSQGPPHARTAPPFTRRRGDDAGSIKEDEVSVVGGAELAPGSPFSSRASSYSMGQLSAVSEGTVARLPRFDISNFSLASAPVSPQVSAAPTPIHSAANLPPLSPDAMESGTCFAMSATPKQVEGGVQTPFGWLVSMLCSYQPVVRERQQHLFVMRHDERADVADPLWKETAQRPWDPPLSEKGKAHAYQVGLKMRRESGDIHRVVCSPYLRCVETAAEVVRALLAAEEEEVKGARPRASTPTPLSSQAAEAGSLGFRQQLVGQVGRGRSASAPKERERSAEEGQQAGMRRMGRGRGARRKIKVRCHIDPGLCEIRTGPEVVPPAAPQGRLLLPRAQLEALLPPESLRTSSSAPPLQPPLGPEDISAGLRRLIACGDRICEQYPQENIVVITHAEAIQAEVMRCLKRASVYNIKFGAFVHLERMVYVDTEDEDDRGVSPWKLASKSGNTGVYFSG